MIVFVIPFKAKKDCTSWSLACKLLDATLTSVCAQTNTNFKVICCVTDEPLLHLNKDSVSFFKVDRNLKNPLSPQICGKRTDKTIKVLEGFKYAKKYNPSYLMVVDADDFISNKLVEYLLSKPLANGFFVDNGFVYENKNANFFMLKKSFHLHCGSGLIISPKLAESLITFNEFTGGWYDHQGKGLLLSSIPFASAMYNTMHSENISAILSIKNRPIFDIADIEECLFTDEIKKEFNYKAIQG